MFCVYIIRTMLHTAATAPRGHPGLEIEMIISSQRYLNEETVAAKRQSNDYVVTLTPEFVVGGESMQAVIDGHHSLAAAIADGVEPEWRIAAVSEDYRIALLDKSVYLYLEVCYMDSDWYDVRTGKVVF